MRDSLPPWAEMLAVFDTETTGVSTVHSRIVTASCAVIDANGQAIERYDWMLDPGVEIPDRAVQVHGITTEMARANGIDAAHGIAQIIEQLSRLLGRGLPLTVYNAPYDLTLLFHEAERYGVPFLTELAPVLDPLVIDKEVDRYRRGKRTLTVVAEHYGVDLQNAHDAGADAIAAGQVMQAIARAHATTLASDIMQVHEAQVTWARAQAENFQRFMRENRDPNFVADGRWPIYA